MKNKIQAGDKVVCRDSYYVKENAGAVGEVVGVIPGLRDDLTVAVVKYHNGTRMKVPYTELELTSKNPLDDEITISRKHFRDLVAMNFGNMSLALVGEKLKNLENDLFGEPGENV